MCLTKVRFWSNEETVVGIKLSYSISVISCHYLLGEVIRDEMLSRPRTGDLNLKSRHVFSNLSLVISFSGFLFLLLSSLDASLFASFALFCSISHDYSPCFLLFFYLLCS